MKTPMLVWIFLGYLGGFIGSYSFRPEPPSKDGRQGAFSLSLTRVRSGGPAQASIEGKVSVCQALARKLERARPEDYPGLYAEIQELGPGATREFAEQLLNAMWIRLDPEGMVEHYRKHTQDPFDDGRYLDTIYHYWAKHDLGLALDHLVSGGHFRHLFQLGWATNEEDSDSLFDFFEAPPEAVPAEVLERFGRLLATIFPERTIVRGASEALMATAVQALAATDPERALALYQDLPDSEEKHGILASVARAIGGEDPRRLIAIAESLTGSEGRELFFGAAIGEVARIDLDLVTAWFSELDDPVQAGQALVRALPDETAVRWVEENVGDGEDRDAIYRALAENESTPIETSLRLVREIDDLTARIDALQKVAERRLDLETRRSVAGVAVELDHDQALRTLVSQVVHHENALDDLLGGLPEEVGHALRIYGNGLRAHADPEGLLVEMRDVPPEDYGQAVNKAGMRLAEWDLDRALTQYEIAEPAMRRDLARGILDVWIRADPAQAGRWLREHPEIADERFYEHVGLRWAQVDPGRLGEWVNALPPGSERDSAALALARMIVRDEPSIAVDWWESLGDVTLRDSYARWMRKRIGDARGISDEAREQLLERIIEP